jgi:hypothetical protein
MKDYLESGTTHIDLSRKEGLAGTTQEALCDAFQCGQLAA